MMPISFFQTTAGSCVKMEGIHGDLFAIPAAYTTKEPMKIRIYLTLAMIALGGTLTSCTVEKQDSAETNTGVAGNSATQAPVEPAKTEPTEAVVPVEEPMTGYPAPAVTPNTQG